VCAPCADQNFIVQVARYQVAGRIPHSTKILAGCDQIAFPRVCEPFEMRVARKHAAAMLQDDHVAIIASVSLPANLAIGGGKYGHRIQAVEVQAFVKATVPGAEDG